MGNSPSKPSSSSTTGLGSTLLDNAGHFLCGSTKDTMDDENQGDHQQQNYDSLLAKADAMCISSPKNDTQQEEVGQEQAPPLNPTSVLLARALVSEVTDNPNTMTPAAMAEREKRLLRAQEAAMKVRNSSSSGSGNGGAATNGTNGNHPHYNHNGMTQMTPPASKPVGTMGQPNVLGSLAHALKGGGDRDDNDRLGGTATTNSRRVVPPSALLEHRAQQQDHQNPDRRTTRGGSGGGGHPLSLSSFSQPNRQSQSHQSQQQQPHKHSVTIGLSLSRRNATVGHPDTVTRQTAFDFNELQDRQYKYVSSTDASGWMAGGGEPGTTTTMASAGQHQQVPPTSSSSMLSPPPSSQQQQPVQPFANATKLAAPDLVHIPIIQIHAESPMAVNLIVAALARGEVFIPHMAVLPEALSVNGISPPDLVVRFGCERNDDVPPEEWPNWCLEFMHNQLYEYFKDMGAQWSIRPFQITLARKVRWKTVKHMNRYFAHAERVIDAWREKGPQYLDPQLSYIEGGATPEEVARPHGIYLLRNGVPTNYFAPNFDPPYTTKMTRSLLLNVLSKSWDKKRREWTSMPVPRLVTPTMLVASMCGCADPNQGGFMANEVTEVHPSASHNVAAARTTTTTVAPAAPADASISSTATTATATAAAAAASSATTSHHRMMAVPPPVKEGRDEEEEEYAQVVDVSMSNKSGESTKVSSVNLTPYDDVDDDGIVPKEGNPMSMLGTTLEDELSLEDESDDDDLFDQDLMDNESPPKVELGSSSTEPKHGGGGAGAGGRYGQSPTPEMGSRFSRSQTPENINNAGSSSSSRLFPRSPTPESARGRSRSPSPPVSPFNGYDEHSSKDLPAQSAPSEFGSTTTVQHMNSTSEKLMQREAERKKLREQKKESLQPLETTEGIEEVSSSTENVTPKSSTSNSKKKKKSRNKVKDAYEKERARQIAMIALAQEETKKMTRSLKAGGALSEKNGNASKYSMDLHPSPKMGQQGMERNDSGSLSLEYSLDSSMLGDTSTLAGQYIGGDASVSTAASRRRTKRMDEDASATTASTDVVPSDEDLFAVGWAKALDPKSGSFYYFTLDRSKIVWENPLAPDDAYTNASSSIPT